ncbi:MAG: DNA mismatch repair endonuclease MutL [Puniceicoccaceae bacterium]
MGNPLLPENEESASATPRDDRSIRILPDQVANQIAAGEVVERPAAVVKELVENSLDAGASRIEVEIRAGGRSLIRIADDGHGMSPDDARLCFLRHATSKIEKAADLFQIRSFGFRGEALPSIASVSRMKLQSRRPRDENGTEILLKDGKVLSEGICGMAPGTIIEVSQLFGSVPARRKFLKKESTESAHVHQVLRLLALAHPKVAFRFLEASREVFHVSPVDQPAQRIRQILGTHLARDLIEVHHEGEGVQIRGFISAPPQSQATRNNLIFFVNSRPVIDRLLSYATIEAFHGWIPRGRYPVSVLFVEVDPVLVDFNVHPAKREIRFREEARVRFQIMTALLNRLEETKPREPKPAPTPINSLPVANPEPIAAASPPSPHPRPETSEPPLSGSSPAASTPPAAASVPVHRQEDSSAPFTRTPRHVPPSGWQFLASYGNHSALFSSPEGLVIVHLRAARERILFEEITSLLRSDKARSQSLLIPETLELSPLQSETLIAEFPLLERIGFRIEEFGRGFFRVEAVPDWIALDSVEPFLADWAAELSSKPAKAGQEDYFLEHLARKSIAFLTPSEVHPPSRQTAEETLSRLLSTHHPLTCPRGRPTMLLYRHSHLLDQMGRDL